MHAPCLKLVTSNNRPLEMDIMTSKSILRPSQGHFTVQFSGHQNSCTYRIHSYCVGLNTRWFVGQLFRDCVIVWFFVMFWSQLFDQRIPCRVPFITWVSSTKAVSWCIWWWIFYIFFFRFFCLFCFFVWMKLVGFCVCVWLWGGVGVGW